ncbi:hypothetical protein Nmel_018915 [Mimus melanotis]
MAGLRSEWGSRRRVWAGVRAAGHVPGTGWGQPRCPGAASASRRQHSPGKPAPTGAQDPSPSPEPFSSTRRTQVIPPSGTSPALPAPVVQNKGSGAPSPCWGASGPVEPGATEPAPEPPSLCLGMHSP